MSQVTKRYCATHSHSRRIEEVQSIRFHQACYVMWHTVTATIVQQCRNPRNFIQECDKYRRCVSHSTHPSSRSFKYSSYVMYIHFQKAFFTGTDKSLTRPHWKNNWKVAIFRSTGRSLLPRRPGWTDKLLNFLSSLQKLDFGRCSLFHTWSG